MATYRDMKELMAQALQEDRIKSMIPEFLRQGQVMLERRLRIRSMETLYISSQQDPVVELALGVKSIASPSDYLEMIFFSLVDQTSKMRYHIYDRKNARYHIDDTNYGFADTTQTGVPSIITRIGSTVYFNRILDKDYDYEFCYFKKLTTLTEEADSNWWTTDASEALLYASLTCAIPLLPLREVKNGYAIDPRISQWQKMSEYLIRELIGNDNRERLSGAPKRVRYQD